MTGPDIRRLRMKDDLTEIVPRLKAAITETTSHSCVFDLMSEMIYCTYNKPTMIYRQSIHKIEI